MKQQLRIVLFLAMIFYTQSDDISANTVASQLAIRLCPIYFCINRACANGYIINAAGCRTCECNPCKYGQPLYQYPCGQGQNQCAAHGGLSKVSTSDNAYCCPNERPGCCPPAQFPQNFLCIRPGCKTDGDCTIGQKCCQPCSRCLNATLA